MFRTALVMLSLCVLCLYSITNMAQVTNRQAGTIVLPAPSIIEDIQEPQEEVFKLPKNLSQRQYDILTMAYEIAKEDGNPHPEIFQGIILTESRACDSQARYKVAGKRERYYGCGQIKLAATKAVLKRHPNLWKYLQTREDDEIIANLILNDRFNLEVASKYFLMMNRGKADNRAIAAYNQGEGGVKNVDPNTFHYTLKVNSHAASHTVKTVNKRITKN